MEVAEDKTAGNSAEDSELAATTTSSSASHLGTSTGNDDILTQDTLKNDLPESEEMKELKEQHDKIQSWLKEVNAKIYELETTYLDETTFGNVIRGWDLDGRFGPLHRSRGIIEEKERLFTYSSYGQVIERKNQPEITIIEKSFGNNNNNNKNNANGNQQKQKKTKKRKSEYDDWNGGEDY